MAYLDDNGLLYFWQKIKTFLAGKVDKVEGKGLSTNDYTTAEKNKLAGLSNYTLPTATASQLGGVKVGANLSINNGVLSADQGVYTLPTASATQLGGIKVGTNLTIDNGVLSAKDTTYSPATTSANGLMSSADKSKLDGFGSADTYALKSDITGMYKYKGSVASVDKLPASGNTTGDVYNVESSGMNYAWDGSQWDALGEIFTITTISNSEIDTILAS